MMDGTTQMADIVGLLNDIVGESNVSVGDAVDDGYTHDEALTVSPVRPLAVVRPDNAEEVARIVGAAVDQHTPVTARGSATGLSGACVPVSGGIVVSFERMNRIVEIDTDNSVAVVQPGVTLVDLDAATAAYGLIYPVFPGESSASLGGNVATNAGGMRAVKYGVTRHHVVGLEAVLGTGDTLRTGGKLMKATSGYDLTQLIIGSEGTLALVTEATLRLYPRLTHSATILAPFATVGEIIAAVPGIAGSGIGPMIVEYIDLVSMAGITANAGIDIGVPQDERDRALAYLVVVLEHRSGEQLDRDVEEMGSLLEAIGAINVYVLPPHAGAQLIDARERAFWAAKAAGADDIVDMVVPRATMGRYLDRVAELAAAGGSFVVGCGHAGDGNVHLSVFQGDPKLRHELMMDIYAAGIGMGGAISGEHGIGTEKKQYLQAFEDPAKLALMRRIKTAFDPHGILNPGTMFD
jgi:glycolate oxidase